MERAGLAGTLVDKADVSAWDGSGGSREGMTPISAVDQLQHCLCTIPYRTHQASLPHIAVSPLVMLMLSSFLSRDWKFAMAKRKEGVNLGFQRFR